MQIYKKSLYERLSYLFQSLVCFTKLIKMIILKLNINLYISYY